MKARPKKYLGQNFLIDRRIQQKIIQACGLSAGDTVVEIGPGQGALTQLIAPHVGKTVCVEKDPGLIGPLRSSLPDSVEVIHADFLKWDMDHRPGTVKVIGNIPYYISTPIIEKLIKDRGKFSSAFLTVQEEFGRRLTAMPGGKDYGSLSCFAQFYAQVEMLFKIKNTCFYPAPKVNSCFLRLSVRPEIPQVNEDSLFKLIQTAFQQRRKTIVNSLKGLTPKDRLEHSLKELRISPQARAENLSLRDYIGLYYELRRP